MRNRSAIRCAGAAFLGVFLVAAIFLQTLLFKFTGAEESRALFEALGAEPWGRIGTGVAELVASGLILFPATAAIGALLGIGLMTGAIGSHLLVLGVEVDGDGGALFAMAVVAFLTSATVAWIRRGQPLALVGKLGASRVRA